MSDKTKITVDLRQVIGTVHQQKMICALAGNSMHEWKPKIEVMDLTSKQFTLK